eukprot:1846801-Amphidinium_carterae.1
MSKVSFRNCWILAAYRPFGIALGMDRGGTLAKWASLPWIHSMMSTLVQFYVRAGLLLHCQSFWGTSVCSALPCCWSKSEEGTLRRRLSPYARALSRPWLLGRARESRLSKDMKCLSAPGAISHKIEQTSPIQQD